ncbi:MAG: hypothetical protein ABI895_42865 [Deltaproteobacteria bacterium]
MKNTIRLMLLLGLAVPFTPACGGQADMVEDSPEALLGTAEQALQGSENGESGSGFCARKANECTDECRPENSACRDDCDTLFWCCLEGCGVVVDQAGIFGQSETPTDAVIDSRPVKTAGTESASLTVHR